MREREREHTHTHLNPYPWVSSVALCFFIVYVGLRYAFDFPQIGFCFGLAPKGSAGVGVATSSHVAQSVVYVICWFHFCIGFPTNRILCCVGSNRACRGLVDHMGGIAAGEGVRERCTVARNRCSSLLGAACALEIAAWTCSGAHTPQAADIITCTLPAEPHP